MGEWLQETVYEILYSFKTEAVEVRKVSFAQDIGEELHGKHTKWFIFLSLALNVLLITVPFFSQFLSNEYTFPN